MSCYIEPFPYGFEVSQEDPDVGQFEHTVVQYPYGQWLPFLSQVPTNEDLLVKSKQRANRLL